MTIIWNGNWKKLGRDYYLQYWAVVAHSEWDYSFLERLLEQSDLGDNYSEAEFEEQL